MPNYTVPIPGGGEYHVNANSLEAAYENVGLKQGGGAASTPSAAAATAGTPAPGTSAQQLASGVQGVLGAAATGNKAALDEVVREYDKTFGLDTQKFQDDIRRFNENLAISQAAQTGVYQGAPALPALTGYATQFGTWGVPTQGQSTLQAQQQQYAQQTGLIAQAAALQANPFRQQQAIGQMGRLLGGQGVAGFSAPNTVAGVGTAGGNNQGGLGYLSQMIQDIRDPTPNQTLMNDVLNGIPTPAKVNSTEFLRSAPSTQSLVLQGMQERYGLDPADSLAQIKATLPQFQAPTTVGTVKR